MCVDMSSNAVTEMYLVDVRVTSTECDGARIVVTTMIHLLSITK